MFCKPAMNNLVKWLSLKKCLFTMHHWKDLTGFWLSTCTDLFKLKLSHLEIFLVSGGWLVKKANHELQKSCFRQKIGQKKLNH
jgi:hypothetical protein